MTVPLRPGAEHHEVIDETIDFITEVADTLQSVATHETASPNYESIHGPLEEPSEEFEI